MLKIICLVFLSFVLLQTPAFAVRVNGYTRSDGTYVQSYERSSPNQYKWDNYGPSDYSGQPASQRDNDGDGISNMRDYDDDNDGISDDRDFSQY